MFGCVIEKNPAVVLGFFVGVILETGFINDRTRKGCGSCFLVGFNSSYRGSDFYSLLDTGLGVWPVNA